MIALIIILCVIACGVLVYCFTKKIHKLNSEVTRLDKYKNLSATEQEFTAQIGVVKQQLQNVREELCRNYTTQKDLEKIQREKLEESFSALNNSVADKREEEQTIQQQIDAAKIQYEEMVERIKQLSETFAISSQQLDEVYTQLNMLQKQHKEATARLQDDNCGRVLDYSPADVSLTNTLDNLKNQYPQLSDAFSTIEWTKIWQTKFQSMTVDLLKDDKCGIYRIFTVSNGEVKSYVGQARKIRERWSQHIKKMLGVEKSDNNKFYSAVKPWDAHFEIIEECNEQDLNTKEHYWIDYYNCVQQGYNTRT